MPCWLRKNKKGSHISVTALVSAGPSLRIFLLDKKTSFLGLVSLIRSTKTLKISQKHNKCGERGIRTLDTVSRIHTFQACSLNHSDISPINNFNFFTTALPRGAPAKRFA
jgi:hypothetical protein